MSLEPTVYFEDVTLEESAEYGPVTVSADSIKAFAREYDPQPFHLDEQAARQTHFRGLAASGWHTCAVTMRLLVDNYFAPMASLGSPGFDDLRWTQPVRPGDELRVRVTCVEKAHSRSHSNRGLARLFVEVLNQRNESVMSLKLMVLIARRDSKRKESLS